LLICRSEFCQRFLNKKRLDNKKTFKTFKKNVAKIKKSKKNVFLHLCIKHGRILFLASLQASSLAFRFRFSRLENEKKR